MKKRSGQQVPLRFFILLHKKGNSQFLISNFQIPKNHPPHFVGKCVNIGHGQSGRFDGFAPDDAHGAGPEVEASVGVCDIFHPQNGLDGNGLLRLNGDSEGAFVERQQRVGARIPGAFGVNENSVALSQGPVQILHAAGAGGLAGAVHQHAELAHDEAENGYFHQLRFCQKLVHAGVGTGIYHKIQ